MTHTCTVCTVTCIIITQDNTKNLEKISKKSTPTLNSCLCMHAERSSGGWQVEGCRWAGGPASQEIQASCKEIHRGKLHFDVGLAQCLSHCVVQVWIVRSGQHCQTGSWLKSIDEQGCDATFDGQACSSAKFDDVCCTIGNKGMDTITYAFSCADELTCAQVFFSAFAFMWVAVRKALSENVFSRLCPIAGNGVWRRQQCFFYSARPSFSCEVLLDVGACVSCNPNPQAQPANLSWSFSLLIFFTLQYPSS